jgi:hypothetical protein
MRGMVANAGGMSDFTGVLVRRQYKSGQKYMQLLFKTAEGVKLTISRNPQLVRSLSEGRTYYVAGQEYKVGDKTVIHEPTAVLVQKKALQSKKLLIIGIPILLISATSVYVLMPAKHSAASHQVQSGGSGSNSNSKKSSDSSDSTPPGASSEQPGPDAQNQGVSTPSVSSSGGTKKSAAASYQAPALANNQQPSSNPVVSSSGTATDNTGQPPASPPADTPVVNPPDPTPVVTPDPSTDPNQTPQ